MDGSERTASGGKPNRRRFVKLLGALGVTGLAGCGGDGDGTGSPDDTTESMETTEPEETTTTVTEDMRTPETPTPTPGTATPVFGDNPAKLVSIEGSPQVAPGSTTTVTAAIENPYLFTVTAGEFTLDAPDGWSVSASGNTFDSIESQSSQTVEWEITAPEDASGSFELAIDGSYSGPNEAGLAEVSTTLSIVVRTPGEAPFGIDCGGIHTAETVTIDGLQFLPDPAFSQGLDLSSENLPVPEEARWWNDVENVTVETGDGATEDAPNAAIFEGDVADTEFDPLYYTEHWLEEGELRYLFNIANGTYEVTLHFAEIAITESGGRVFTVTINGDPVLEELDIYDEVGEYTAMTRSFEVEVTNNELVIGATASANNPKFSGIEVREA